VKSEKNKIRAQKTALILVAAAVLTAVLMNLEFKLLESTLYDYRMANGPQPQADPEIALITLDDSTVKELDEFSPLPLDFHARFLEALAQNNPKAVGYLVDMNRVNQANPDLFRSEWGNRFVKAAGDLEARGIPVLIGTSFDVTGEVVPPYPLSALPHSIAVIHKDGNVFAEDKVTRRALMSLYDRPVFHTELASRLGLLKTGAMPRGSFYVPEIDGQYLFFRYHGNTAVEHGGGKRSALPYPTVSFLDVLRGTPAAKQLDGKIVLIGTMTREDSSDFAFTPFSRTPFVNPKLVVHANILDTVINESGITRAPQWFAWAMTFFATAFVFWWVLNSTPLKGLFASIGIGLAFLLGAQYLFTAHGLWIRLSQPMIAIFLGYYLVVPFRLILEYKKRWDYQRKNELLVQVEELKTNFLSLVTHDLKTPVARIQGLAEVLLRKASERLIERDRETVEHIIGATDELNRFITSILELNKVESNRLTLNLESKDVNQLIEKSVDGFKAQSRASRITIESNLEPLFPVKLDSTLICKVVNNLIDNALKYSPAGSTIRVESREIANQIEISVSDQGIGLSEDEVENLFTRFYRAKNATTSAVAGTGLGLYLTKYFIEAHQGRVVVESAPGAGSTFRIILPLDPEAHEGSSKKPGLRRGLMKFFNKEKQYV